MSDSARTDFDAFISYSHKDSECVELIDVFLRAAGLRVFLDKRDVAVGDPIIDRVTTGLAEARAQVVVLSANSVNSRWVADELAMGRHRNVVDGMRIAPVLIELCEVPTSIRHLKYLDMTSWRRDGPFRRAGRELLRSLALQPATTEDSFTRFLFDYFVELHYLKCETERCLGELLGGEHEALNRGGPPAMAMKLVLKYRAIGAHLIDSLDAAGIMGDILAEAAEGFPDHGFQEGLEVTRKWLARVAGGCLEDPRVATILRLLSETHLDISSAVGSRGRILAGSAARADSLRSNVGKINVALSELIAPALLAGLPSP